jgi:hypothetical protein
VELMVAAGVGLPLAGAVVMLLLQTSYEQRRGLADSTVEESAYVLQSRITSCLRSASAEGLTPVYASATNDPNGVLLGYQTVFVFHPNTNGGEGDVRGRINFDPSSGAVTYTPDDVNAPNTQIVWMTNSPDVVLHQLFFNTSFNPDGSLDSSLVRVCFQMDDNGFSQQNPSNNVANIYRSFSVQMRIQ